jgi:glycosyltransferase involved in cell wall biosynthesis
LPLWLVQNDYFDEAVIWRLSDKKIPDVVFDIDGRKFIQRWVKSFSQCIKYPSPNMSFFRGGFSEYDQITKSNPLHYGKKFYLGAGRRVTPQYGGKYDVILAEDERDIKTIQRHHKCQPFFKTASDKIFRPLNLPKKYDICWPANFAQIRHKGQEDFIQLIAKYNLSDLKIVSCGNHPKIGKQLCDKYGVKNITFLGEVNRSRLNEILNLSAFGLNMSNQVDGCPRVSTEILMSGTPLIVRDTVRLLNYYKKMGVIEINESNFVNKILNAFKNYDRYRKEIREAIQGDLSFETNNKKNIDIWRH